MPLQPSQAAPVMAESAAPTGNGPAGGGATAAAAPAGPQTVEVPAAACQGAKAGDMVQFKVVSIDDQSGVANLVPVSGASDGGMDEDAGGSDGMASEFSKANLNKAAM